MKRLLPRAPRPTRGSKPTTSKVPQRSVVEDDLEGLSASTPKVTSAGKTFVGTISTDIEEKIEEEYKKTVTIDITKFMDLWKGIAAENSDDVLKIVATGYAYTDVLISLQNSLQHSHVDPSAMIVSDQFEKGLNWILSYSLLYKISESLMDDPIRRDEMTKLLCEHILLPKSSNKIIPLKDIIGKSLENTPKNSDPFGLGVVETYQRK